MNDDEARELLEGGPGRPERWVQDVAEGRGPFAFGAPEWSGIAKLAEELGELQAVLGKLIGTGGDRQHWQGDLVPQLEEEMGDVGAALEHVLNRCPHIDKNHVEARWDLKGELFNKWASRA
jgi:hypothetical protein